MNPAAPIGVFDSGIGGLTVLRSLRRQMPGEQFLYLGDTARLPYGTKSSATVVRYALQAGDALTARGIKALVVACNTASATALGALRERFDPLPVFGVVEPGAQAAVTASRTGRILVLATEGTVRGGAYQQAIQRLRASAQPQAVACQLFVALAEEGWSDNEVALAAARRYLQPIFAAPEVARPDTIVLGCTHFPVLQAVIASVAGPDVAIVDSADTTAAATRQQLARQGMLVEGTAGGAQLLATDSAARFVTAGERFLGRPVQASEVELIDL